MKFPSYLIAPVFTFILSGLLWSCSNVYDQTEPITSTSAYPRAIERAKKNKRYFIMHSGVDVYRIKTVEVEKSKQQFTVYLDRLDSLHRVNMNNTASLPDKLIHVYMADSTSYTLDEPHTIPLNKVARIELSK